MNYFGTVINSSPTLAEKAGTEILNGQFLALKYNDTGEVVVCDTVGENVAGILMPDCSNVINKGDDVSIQIKDIGMAKSGAAIKKGIELMVDATGKLIPATAGKFIVGYALSSASAADEIISVDIRKCGYR